MTYSHSVHRLYRWVIFLGGILFLCAGTAMMPVEMGWLWFGLVVALFVTFQAIFPIYVLRRELNLTHAILLGAALLVGPVVSAWSVLLGMLLGYGLRRAGLGRLFRGSVLSRALSAPFLWLDAFYTTGSLFAALFIAAFVLDWRVGLASLAPPTPAWGALLGFSLLFTGLHVAFMLADFFLPRRFQPENLWRDLAIFGLVELLPLPFILVAAMAFPQAGIDTTMTLGGISAIVMALAYTVRLTRGELERRLKELSALNEISQTLRSTLELDNLLAQLQLQVRQLLGVDNFYVALYDRDAEQIWYPVSVKRGQMVYWPPRPLADRLTDRVIGELSPILIAQHAELELPRIGLPVGEEPPFAWMGVPLVTSERAIGCLAAFSYSPDVVFRQADLDLLLTLSGQVSVAVENALLFEQVRRRQLQLETMNHITTLLTGSQNPQEVLAQVCRSVIEVGGGEHSAIYLSSPEEGKIWMAYAHNLSDDYVRQNQAFPISHDGRTRCLRTGLPMIIPDLASAQLETDFIAALQGEGVRAFADFPLITPEGQIGYLSVYFDSHSSLDEEVVRLLQTFAAQAALAVSNARLHARTDTALARRAHQLSILETVGRELSAAIQSEHLFSAILEYALEFTNSPWGNLALYDQASVSLQVRAARGYLQEITSLPVAQGISGRVVREQRTVNVPDVSADPDTIDLSGGQARSQLSVPLRHKGSVLGVLTLESAQPNAYSLNDQAFIGQLADQAAVAVVNAELYTNVASGRDRLVTVIDSVREGILMVDLGGYIVLVNQFVESVTGKSASELIGQRLVELPGQVLAVLGYTGQDVAELAEVLKLGQTPQVSKAIVKLQEGGREKVLERSVSAVEGQDGATTGWMIMLRDVTEEFQIASERELLTETLVHDLRSPVGAVLGALDVIQEYDRKERPEGSLIGQAVDVARRGAHRVLGLIESVLDIARMESGGVEISCAWLDMRSLIKNVLAEFSVQARDYDLTINSEVSKDCPYVYADKSKVNRVLANLVDNAVKFTREGSRITVAAGLAEGDMLVVRVSDNGPGIPEEYRQKIFERFLQVPGQAGRRRGSGLGLTFCRLAVEAHGGRIWVEDEPQGGAVFVFTLPVGGPKS